MSTLKLTDFDKVLVSYLHEPSKLVAKVKYAKESNEPQAVLEQVKGNKKGVIVAIGEGILGWSMCNTTSGWTRLGDFHEGDRFDKEKGISIALNRAKYVESLDEETRREYYGQNVPESLLELFVEMDERAVRYFGPKVVVEE